MEKALKKELQRIVDEAFDYVLKDSRVKRIIITNSTLLNLNFTHNRCLNKQAAIDGKIKVEIIQPYNPLKDHREGDYILNIDDYLKSTHSKVF